MTPTPDILFILNWCFIEYLLKYFSIYLLKTIFVLFNKIWPCAGNQKQSAKNAHSTKAFFPSSLVLQKSLKIRTSLESVYLQIVQIKKKKKKFNTLFKTYNFTLIENFELGKSIIFFHVKEVCSTLWLEIFHLWKNAAQFNFYNHSL